MTVRGIFILHNALPITAWRYDVCFVHSSLDHRTMKCFRQNVSEHKHRAAQEKNVQTDLQRENMWCIHWRSPSVILVSSLTDTKIRTIVNHSETSKDKVICQDYEITTLRNILSNSLNNWEHGRRKILKYYIAHFESKKMGCSSGSKRRKCISNLKRWKNNINIWFLNQKKKKIRSSINVLFSN